MWFSDLHLVIFPSVISDETLPLSIHRSSPFLSTMNLEKALLVNLPTASL